MMVVEGWIEILSCTDCGATQPNWVFSADTDMATNGLQSAGDRHGNMLLLSKSFAAEGNSELRVAEFKHAERTAPSAAGIGFAEYRKVHAAPKLVFSCPWCEDGEMTASRKLASHEFATEGGKLDCRDGIVIREGN